MYAISRKNILVWWRDSGYSISQHMLSFDHKPSTTLGHRDTIENKTDPISGGKVPESHDRTDYTMRAGKASVPKAWIFPVSRVPCKSWGLRCGGFREEVPRAGFLTKTPPEGNTKPPVEMVEEGTAEKRYNTRGEECTFLPKFPVPKTVTGGRTRMDFDSAGLDSGHHYLLWDESKLP